MPTTLPVKDIRSTELRDVPLPVCMGPPTQLWVETIKTDKDVRGFWRGYAIGGAVCTVLLAVEIAVIMLI